MKSSTKLLIVAAAAGVGYVVWRARQRATLTAPPAPPVPDRAPANIAAFQNLETHR